MDGLLSIAWKLYPNRCLSPATSILQGVSVLVKRLAGFRKGLGSDQPPLR
jgi:hypothetical protein